MARNENPSRLSAYIPQIACGVDPNKISGFEPPIVRDARKGHVWSSVQLSGEPTLAKPLEDKRGIFDFHIKPQSMRIVLDPSAKSFEKVMVLSRLFLADIGIEITAGGPQVYVNSKEGGAQQFTMHSRFLVELRPEQAARLLELNLKLWNLYTVTTNVRTPYIMKLAHFQIGEIMNGCRKGHMFLTRFNLEHLGPIDRVEIRDSYCQP